jgi:hypothetical protein
LVDLQASRFFFGEFCGAKVDRCWIAVVDGTNATLDYRTIDIRIWSLLYG